MHVRTCIYCRVKWELWFDLMPGGLVEAVHLWSDHLSHVLFSGVSLWQKSEGISVSLYDLYASGPGSVYNYECWAQTDH